MEKMADLKVDTIEPRFRILRKLGLDQIVGPSNSLV